MYMLEGIGKFPKLYQEVRKHDDRLRRYEYVNLSHAGAIRVLRLSPSESDTAPLVCSIEEVILDYSPRFEALSYAWDDEKGNGYVNCNGAVLRVSKNCEAALRRIRIQQGQTPKRLWVDAICINQGALAEKARQLAMMGEIYKKAARVIVWLGEHDEPSVRVLKFFEVVAGSYKSERQRYQTMTEWQRSQTATEALQMVRRWHRFSEALAQFFKRSWFTRMWPIQEVTLPYRGRVQMLCGTTEMPFENLRFGWNVLKALGLLPTAVNLDQAVALQFYIADAIALKRNEGETSWTAFSTPLITDLSQFSLSSVMNATRYKACKYPKDKFFALYGVFQELQISFDITPSMYNDRTDADIMRAVMVACLKHDGNLDALRLCHLAEPYISSEDFVRTRQDPYDSLSTAVFAMTRRMGRVLQNVYKARELNYVPGLEWRTTLPSWVPDWTQWTTRSPDPIRDIQFLHSYSSVFVQVSDPVMPAPAQKLTFTPEDAVCGICSVARGSEAECLGPTTHYEVSGSVLNVEAKILGPVTELGSVDSIAVLWQVLIPNSNPHLSWSRSSVTGWIQDFGHRSPDPALAALLESMINFVWRSRMAQVFISLRMALKTLGFADICAYIGAVGGVGWTGPRSKEILCMRHASIASCPTDGFAMRKLSKRSSLYETQFIITMFNNFLNGRKPLNSDMWYDLTGTALATLSYLLWDCRVSISESLFGGRYDEMEWGLLAPVYVYIMSALVQTVADGIGDTAFLLLGQAVTALTGIWGLVVFLIWAQVVTIPVFVIFGVRACYKSPWQVLGGIFGSEEFRPGDAFTPGMHFFSTEGGITGNTSGPVREKDLLVMVRGCCEYSILRRREEGFIFIGSAYVGNKGRQITVNEGSEWTKIALY
jgi:Heterokaryon incompatibility protein (HET)